MAKLPIPKMPAGFKYNPSKLQSGGTRGSSIHRSTVNDTLSAASASGVRAPARMPLSRVANVNKGSNPDSIVGTYKNMTAPARPARAATPKAPKYSAADREAYLTSKQANKVRGREEGRRISKGRDKEAATLLNKPASGTVDDMVSRNKALGREERADARARKSAPRVQGSGGGASPKVSGSNAGSSKTGGRVNLGETVGDGTFSGQATGALKMGRKNFSTQMADRGGAASYMGRAAVQGAVWGGGIGGTVSAAQGGDFWAGAKEGAFKGAVGVAGFKGLRAASGTSSTGLKSIGDTFANSKAVWQHHGKGNVSKSVIAQQRLHQNI